MSRNKKASFNLKYSTKPYKENCECKNFKHKRQSLKFEDYNKIDEYDFDDYNEYDDDFIDDEDIRYINSISNKSNHNRLETTDPTTSFHRMNYTNGILTASRDNTLVDEIPILASSFSRVVEHIHEGSPIMMISAFRYENSKATNLLETQKLIKNIIAKGYNFTTIKGYWADFNNETKEYDTPQPEITLLVVGKKGNGEVAKFNEFKSFGCYLCRLYNQTCVMVGKAVENESNTKYTGEVYFKFYNSNGTPQNSKFNKIRIADSPKTFEKIHEAYLEEIKGINYGYGYSNYKNKDTKWFQMVEANRKIITYDTVVVSNKRNKYSKCINLYNLSK